MRFLILGANFQNKGAQAMLFTAVSELRTMFPSCEIYFLSKEPPHEGYEFTFFYDLTGWDYLKGGRYSIKAIARIGYLKHLGYKNIIRNAKRFIKIMKSIDAFVDISGYALSSQRGVSRSISFLNQIRVAQRLKIPYFIMPQSIGPFDYGNKQKQMDKLLNRYLPYPAIIMPREEEGFKLLTEVYGLNNVKQSYDLVLQNKGLNLDNVVNSAYKNQIPKLQSSGNVAIIPNDRNFTYGNHDRYNNLYWNLITRLQYHKKSVYIIRHSREDLDACKMIYEGLQDKQGVHLLEDDFDCIQFNGLVQQMDYIIGSRYHGIVHAFKNSVPAIVLGWATKYKVLLSMFDQDRFLFDVRGDIDEGALLNAIDDMEERWQDEKRIIGERLGGYQTKNCFAYVNEYFKE